MAQRRLISRRSFVGGFAALSSCVAAPLSAFASKDVRIHLDITNATTNERLGIDWVTHGRINRLAVKLMHYVMRDAHEDVAVLMDLNLYLLLSLVRASVAPGKSLMVTSGYRTPKTNSRLLESGATQRSYHLEGKAADVYVPGVPPEKIFYAAQKLKMGGCGLYKSRGFVHLDVGRVRTWRA